MIFRRVSAESLHAIEVLPLFRGQVGAQGQADQAEDAVHGGADLMAHVGQKFALGAACRIGGYFGLTQFPRLATQRRDFRLRLQESLFTPVSTETANSRPCCPNAAISVSECRSVSSRTLSTETARSRACCPSSAISVSDCRSVSSRTASTEIARSRAFCPNAAISVSDCKRVSLRTVSTEIARSRAFCPNAAISVSDCKRVSCARSPRNRPDPALSVPTLRFSCPIATEFAAVLFRRTQARSRAFCSSAAILSFDRARVCLAHVSPNELDRGLVVPAPRFSCPIG